MYVDFYDCDMDVHGHVDATDVSDVQYNQSVVSNKA